MTIPDTPEQDPPQDPTAEQRKQRAAVGCLALIGATAAVSIGIAIPETAYYAAGLMTLAAYRKGRTWFTGRRDSADEADVVDIVAALHELSPAGAANVRITQLVESTGLPDRDAVRALLDAGNIPFKEVRTGGKVGQGVIASAIPRSCGAPPGSCWCAVTSNNNTNNTPEEGPEKGLRVDHIGEAGLIYRDPAETITRHHAIKK